jgi:hypothetical protein
VSFPSLTRRDVWRHLTNEKGRRLVPLSWTFDALDALDDDGVRELLVWCERQVGKTTWIYAAGISELLTRPGSYTIIIGASEGQTEATFARKLRRPLERLARELGIESAVRFTKGGVEVPDLGSAIEILATNAATGPARTVDKLFIDEARDVPDKVFEVLAPSIIGAGGTLVVASTAGPMRGFFYQLIQNPTEQTRVIHPLGNENPEASRSARDFLVRRFGLLFPQAARRELANEFTDDGDVLIPWALIDAAIDDNLTEAP